MNILQVVNYIYPQISGIGVTAMDIAQALQINAKEIKKEINQRIICINNSVIENSGQLDMSRNIFQRVGGIEVIRCKMDLHIASQPISFSYITLLKRCMDQFRPDVVIFHYPNPYLAEFLLHYKRRDFKLIVWWHSDIVKQKILGKLFIKQNYDLLRRADRLIATSQNYIDGSRYLSKYRNKCTVIPSCVHEQRMKITAADRKHAMELKPEGKILCFSMGRHVAYKGFEYLIEASKYLDDKYVFVIGSSGPLTEVLKEKTKLDSRFIFTGHLSEDELKAYYIACDIFCFPSITRNEAFGLALADAMYYGKPAVTFTISGSGVNFVSKNGVTGIEVENRNAKKYANAIKRLAEDAYLRERMGKAAHERAVKYFTFKKFRESIISVVVGSLNRGV